jgi:tetratricopeptide (TPR) repeat protein
MMKARTKGVIFVGLFFLVNFLGAQAGGVPGAFLSLASSSARAVGLANAYVAVADDSSAAYFNPAGLVAVEEVELCFYSAPLFFGTSYHFFNIIYPTLDQGVLGVSLAMLKCGGIEGRNEYNEKTGQTFTDQRTAFWLSYGRPIIKNLTLGLNAKVLKRSLGESQDSFTILDLGALYDFSLWVKSLKLGCNLQNLMSTSSGDTEDRLPLHCRVGLTYSLIDEKLLLATDLNFSKRFTFHLGSEYLLPLIYGCQFKVRLGVETDAFNLGFGMRRKFKNMDYTINYAFMAAKLENKHRFSLNLGYNIGLAKKRQEKAEAFYQLAQQDYEAGKYRQAMAKVEKCIDLDAENLPALKLQERLKVVNKNMRVKYQEVAGEEKIKKLLRKSIGHYLEGRLKKSANVLQYIISLEPDNEVALKLLKVVSEETGEEMKAQEIKEGGIDLVEQKLWNSLQYFYDGKYDLVIKECQEVLELEPENILAYKRMGSAYFAMGNKEKAKEIWQKALQIAPDDEELKEFLKNNGKKE